MCVQIFTFTIFGRAPINACTSIYPVEVANYYTDILRIHDAIAVAVGRARHRVFNDALPEILRKCIKVVQIYKSIKVVVSQNSCKGR